MPLTPYMQNAGRGSTQQQIPRTSAHGQGRGGRSRRTYVHSGLHQASYPCIQSLLTLNINSFVFFVSVINSGKRVLHVKSSVVPRGPRPAASVSFIYTTKVRDMETSGPLTGPQALPEEQLGSYLTLVLCSHALSAPCSLVSHSSPASPLATALRT